MYPKLHSLPTNQKIDLIREKRYLHEYTADRDWMIRSIVASIKNKKTLDMLVNDEAWQVRVEIARHGYALDKLVNDEAWQVRFEVAALGYNSEIFEDDESWQVRDITSHLNEIG